MKKQSILYINLNTVITIELKKKGERNVIATSRGDTVVEKFMQKLLKAFLKQIYL